MSQNLELLRKPLALLAAVPLVLGLTAAHSSPSAASVADSQQSDEQDYVQEYLVLSSPVLSDVIPTLPLPTDATFAGVRYENGIVTGEDYYSDQSSTVWAADFEAMYGVPPRTTHVIVMVPEEEDAPEPSDVSTLSTDAEPNTVEDLAAGTIDIPAGTPIPADEISATSAIASQYAASQAASADAPSAASAAAAAGVYWSPTFTEHGVRPVTLPSGQRAGFYNFYSWAGVDHQPAHLDPKFGIEFETNLYDLTSPMVGSRPACSAQPVPFIALPGYKEHYWAVNYGWSWSALSNSAGNAGTNPLPYADINDLFDDCWRQSIAIGLEFPQNLYDGSGTADFMYVINAPFGNESSSGVAGVLQAVENQTCGNHAQQYGSYVPTDCMGLNGDIKPSIGVGDSALSYLTLNSTRGYTVPSLCWRNVSGGAVLQFDGTFNCAYLGGG